MQFFYGKPYKYPLPSPPAAIGMPCQKYFTVFDEHSRH